MKRNTMMAFALLLLTSLESAFAASCFDGSSPFAQPEWQHCQVIREPDLLLYYSYQEDEQNVQIGLHASTHAEGWSALALAGNGGMKGASQIVVRQNNEGEFVAEDRYSDDYATPMLDESQDVRLLFAQQEGGQTAWGVSLMINSCDEQDYPIEDISRWMHWALGPSHDFTFHGSQRGQFHANLLSAPQVLPDPSSLDFVDFAMPNVTVELGDGGQDPTNPYICSMFDLGELLPASFNITDKIHAVHLSAILNPESRPYVHHMLLYACPTEYEEEGEYQHLKIIPECESMPIGCDRIKFAWAVGAQDIAFPPEVGLAFGQGEKWLALQMHYYNPDLDPDIIDSSGARVYLSPTVRDVDAGFMELNGGTSPWDRAPIPAGQTSYTLNPFILPSACTENWATDVNVLAAIHHMHLVGQTMQIDVERDGDFLGTVRREYMYDFNHQSLEPPSIRTLLPGDQLNIFCSYDTSTRSNETVFGDLSQHEMCYSLLLYYPQQPDLESFYYFEPPSDEELEPCIMPGTGNFSEVSLCSQYFVQDMPAFFGVFDESFAALDYCNGGAGSDEFRTFVSEICPPCYEDQSCTVEDMVAVGTFICQDRCQEYQVTLYPNASVTKSPFTQGYGCGEVDETLFVAPEPVARGVCERVGDLSVPTVAPTQPPFPVAPTQPPSDDAAGTSSNHGLHVSLFQLALSCLVAGSLFV